MNARGRRRRWVRMLGRTISALAVLALGAAAVAVGEVSPPPDPVAVPAIEVAVDAPAVTLACPGPVRLPTEPTPGEDVVYDPAFDPQPVRSDAVLGVVTVAPEGGTGAPAGTAGTAAASTTLRALGAADGGRPVPVSPDRTAGALLVDDLDGARVVRAEPVGDVPALAAAVVRVSTASGDLRGLAAASCRPPTAESWLVGGGTELGSSARLVLQNPGRTPATVRISLWGPAGPVEPAGAPEYLVPAGTERAVLLEGVAAQQRRIVVQTAASGGQVVAYLQDSRLNGLVPGGVDYVVGGQPPATRQVVPGLSVRGAGVDGTGPVLRLLAPGSQDVTARITLVGRGGTVDLPGAHEVALAAGAVLDVPLSGLPDGDYTVVVEADAPVVAGAMTVRAAVSDPFPAGASAGASDGSSDEAAPAVTTDVVDRAWAPSVASGSAPASAPASAQALALPPGARGRLVLAHLPVAPAAPETPATPATGATAGTSAGTSGPVADGASAGATAVLEVVGDDGVVLETRPLDLPAGATTTVDLGSLLPSTAGDGVGVAGVVLRGAGPGVVWAAVLEGPAAVAVLSPVPPPPAQPTVAVRVR